MAMAVLLAGVIPAHAAAAEIFIDPMFNTAMTSNVVYGTGPTGLGPSVQLTMDIFRPVGPDVPDNLPVVIMMHGGYYASGSKSSMHYPAQELARRGYVTASIDYRKLNLLPPAPGELPDLSDARLPSWVPGQLIEWRVTLEQYAATIAAATSDLGKAVDYFANNADTYNIDPARIAVGGYSAGAVSSLLLGAGALDGVQADVRVAISVAGGMFGFESAIGPGTPAIYMLHGTADDVIPYSEMAYIEQAMNAAGLPFESHTLLGQGHGIGAEPLFDNDSNFLPFLRDNLLPVPVPEPGTWILAILALPALLLLRHRTN